MAVKGVGIGVLGLIKHYYILKLSFLYGCIEGACDSKRGGISLLTFLGGVIYTGRRFVGHRHFSKHLITKSDPFTFGKQKELQKGKTLFLPQNPVIYTQDQRFVFSYTFTKLS